LVVRLVDGKVSRVRRDGWYERAECRGAPTDVFFPVYENAPGAFDEALSYCARCPVRAECLEAGQREPCGMWGGTSPAERSKAPSKHAA
jgi:hypothetical protein